MEGPASLEMKEEPLPRRGSSFQPPVAAPPNMEMRTCEMNVIFAVSYCPGVIVKVKGMRVFGSCMTGRLC